MPTVTPFLRPVHVALDFATEPVACLLDPRERWNGFACPYFTREQIPALLDLINRGGDMQARLDDDDVVRVVSPDYGQDEPEEFPVVEVDGVQMWAVGAWCWTWQIASVGSACPDCGQTPDEPTEGWHSCPTCGRTFEISHALDGYLTTVECPGCAQRIYLRDDGSTECGGRDEGTCMAANYAHDAARGISDPEWLADENCAPPSPGECDSILMAHRLVSDGEAR